MNRNKRRPGYSLIELLIVMAVLTILIGMAIPQFHQVLSRNRVRTARGVMASVRLALEMYKTNYGGYPADTQITDLNSLYNLLSPNLTRDPKTNFNSFISYETAIQGGATKPTTYTLVVTANVSETTPITATPRTLQVVYGGELIE